MVESMVESVVNVVDGMTDCVLLVVFLSLVDGVSILVDSIILGLVIVVNGVIEKGVVFVVFSTVLVVAAGCEVDSKALFAIRVVSGVVLVVVCVADGVVLVVILVFDGVVLVVGRVVDDAVLAIRVVDGMVLIVV